MPFQTCHACTSSTVFDSETDFSFELLPFASMLRKSVNDFFTPTPLWGVLLPLFRSGDFPPFEGLIACAGERVGVPKADLYGVVGTGTEYGTEILLRVITPTFEWDENWSEFFVKSST